MRPMVRYAKHEELPRVNELQQMVSELHAAERPDIFRPGFCDELRQHGYSMWEAPDADVIVAEADGRIVEFALVRYIDRPASPYMCARRVYHIEEFGVDAAYRRGGVGTALIEFCRAEAAQRQFEKMELDVWAFNEGAQKFYEAAGFTVCRSYMEIKV